MTNIDLEELLAEVFCLLLHDCGLFLHQELDSFLFKSFSRVIIRMIVMIITIMTIITCAPLGTT